MSHYNNTFYASVAGWAFQWYRHCAVIEAQVDVFLTGEVYAEVDRRVGNGRLNIILAATGNYSQPNTEKAYWQEQTAHNQVRLK